MTAVTTTRPNVLLQSRSWRWLQTWRGLIFLR